MLSSSKFEKICANLFVLMVTLFLMFMICELLMKFFLFHPSYNFQTAGMLKGHGNELKVELIPDNLYWITPNKRLGINQYGFRDHEFSTDKHGLKRICFLGDSFTMGLNVEASETMPKMLEKQLKNLEVYNMGVVGFGPDQELNVLKKIGFKFKPDIVIQAICAINDSGDIFKDGLYTMGAKDELEETRSNPVKSLVFSSEFAIVNQINFIKNRDYIVYTLDPVLFGDTYDLSWMKYADSDEAKFKYSLMKEILKKTYDEANSRKINYLAVIIPSYDNTCNDKFFKENNVDPNRYFINEQFYQYMLDSQNIQYINLAPYMMHLPLNERCALFQPDNGHLSPMGNWFASQVISRFLDNLGWTK